MRKQIGPDNECFLCGQNGNGDPLDRHHIFGGANRKLSEEDGLCVMLCHNKCHLHGHNSVHQNADTMLRLHKIGQRYAMVTKFWTAGYFRQRYGKNYLDESGPDIWPEEAI